MPPLRRYLRVSKYTVLECRIWTDPPSDSSWLVSGDTLQRIFASIKPLVQPKLSESREKRGKKSGKPVRDVVDGEDFEASVYMTKTGTFHGLLWKQRTLHDDSRRTLSSNSEKMQTVIRQESEDPDGIPADIPETSLFLPHNSDVNTPPSSSCDRLVSRPDHEHVVTIPEDDEDDEDDMGSTAAADEKKKLSFRLEYDGFTIYDHVLCLIIKRKPPRGKERATATATGDGMAVRDMIGEWIQMSQAVREDAYEDGG